MRVYAAEWCDCTYESAFAVLSLHDTEEGAEAALQARLSQKAAEEKEMHEAGYSDYEESSAGRVREIEVLTTPPAGKEGEGG